MHANDGYIEMASWGKDHWSTFAYVETVVVECAGFQVGADPRMKANRRNFRVMHAQFPRPRRARQNNVAFNGMAMRPEHATRLADGTAVENHDDWCCLQDMCAAGLFTASPEDVEPGAVLHLSKEGAALAASLREHKAAGGTFSTFRPCAREAQVA